jgi:hypothetical protein
MKIDYDVKRYVADCLTKEERNPVGMFGHWAYYAIKEKEYRYLKEGWIADQADEKSGHEHGRR